MGVGDLTDSLIGGAGDLVDGGKKLLGETIDAGSDIAADGLDMAGAHDWAGKTRHYGDQAASALGATPGEQQLGQSDDPTDLVHGNAKDILATAQHLKHFHTAFDKVGQGMRKLDSSQWQGEAAEAFRKKFAMHPVSWLHAADACHQAAAALEHYADTVTWAQRKAQEAIDLYKKATHASEQAREAYDKRVVAYEAALMSPDEDPGPRPGDFHDPATADFEHAREVLDAARRQRDTAAGIASDVVQAALAHAPAEPPLLTQLKVDAVDGYNAFNTEAVHFGAGLLKGTAGLYAMTRGANPLDPYNLAHPAEALQHQAMTLAGLVSSATHPERTLKQTLQDFARDPAEFGGRLTPQVLLTDGVGLEAGGIRAAAREGMESGATSVAGRGARYGDDLAGDSVHADSLDPDAARSFLDDQYPELKDLNVPHSGSAESGFHYTPHVSDDVWRTLDVEQKHQVGAAELSDGAVSFPNEEAATTYGREHWNNYVDNLPPSQQQALRDYTDEPLVPGSPGSATYKEMNGYLRGDVDFHTPEVLHNIREVDRALAGNPLPQDVMVVRGTNMGHVEYEYPEQLEGRTLHDNAYTSTSLGNHPVPSFAGKEAVLHLRVPQGTPALWVEKVGNFGAEERELLLGRGMSYKVMRSFMDDKGQIQIYGEVLPVR